VPTIELHLRWDKRALIAAAMAELPILASWILYIAQNAKAVKPDADLGRVLSSINNVDLLVLLGMSALTIPVYLLSRPLGDRKPEHIIDDLLKLIKLAAAIAATFRVNIMKLRTSRPDPVPPFGFVRQIDMRDLHNYEGRITLSTRGVGTAYANPGKVEYLGPDEVDRNVDAWPKHVFSYRPPACACVLNVDTNVSQLSPDHIERIKTIVKHLGDIIALYHPARLDFLN
jgi:hypothetical protein